MDVKHTTMLLIILVTFSLLVIAIGLTTAKLNAKPPCVHDWLETDNNGIKCSKCSRVIRHIHEEAGPEAELQLVKDKPGRPEGIRIAPHLLQDPDLHDA